MTPTTLAAIEAAHQKLGSEFQELTDMIAAFKAQPLRAVRIAETEIELRPDEHYAGIVLDEDGTPSHHLILLPGDVDDVTWSKAKEFAAKAGGELPTRREQSMLFANLKGQFEERYYWSSEQHAAIDDYAWLQDFGYGDQNSDIKSAELRARAVRRLTIQ